MIGLAIIFSVIFIPWVLYSLIDDNEFTHDIETKGDQGTKHTYYFKKKGNKDAQD